MPRRRATSRSCSRAGCPGVPVVVGANRYEAGRLARERFGVTAIVLDDGFQHRTLRKDLEIVMARAAAAVGQRAAAARAGRCASRSRGLAARAPGRRHRRRDRPRDAAEVAAAVARYAPALPVLTAMHVPTECLESGAMRFVPLSALAGARLLAFAGIASPAGFRRTLAEPGVDGDRLRRSSPTTTGTRARTWRVSTRGPRGAAPTGSSRPRRTGSGCARCRPLRRPLYVLERAPDAHLGRGRRGAPPSSGWTAAMNVVVRLPNWLGDTVMAVPALRAVRAAWPEARVLAAGPVGRAAAPGRGWPTCSLTIRARGAARLRAADARAGLRRRPGGPAAQLVRGRAGRLVLGRAPARRLRGRRPLGGC